MCLKYSFAFKNAGNIQEPSIKAVGYSFDQRQVNEISDMQLFIRDGTINEKKNKNKKIQEETKVPVTTSYGKFVF